MARKKQSRTSEPRYQRQRERLKRRARANDEPCIFCGQLIDWRAKWPDPWSFTADHETPVKAGGRNSGEGVVLRPAHNFCNTSAGNRHRPDRDAATLPSRPGDDRGRRTIDTVRIFDLPETAGLRGPGEAGADEPGKADPHGGAPGGTPPRI